MPTQRQKTGALILWGAVGVGTLAGLATLFWWLGKRTGTREAVGASIVGTAAVPKVGLSPAGGAPQPTPTPSPGDIAGA